MSPDDGDAGGPLEHLLALQDLDITVTQLERRKVTLPERASLAEVDARRSALARQAAEVARARDALALRQDDLERQIATLSARRQAVEQRLYGARGGAARDLQAMDEEVRHLTARRAELEEEELGVMVEMEPVDARLASIAEELAVVDAEVAAGREALATAEAVVDRELAEVIAARTEAATHVPGDLRDRYETLRARMGGIGAARLIGNRCSGCHLELPAREVDRIRRLPEGTVATCDQCGRILVPSHAPSGSGPSSGPGQAPTRPSDAPPRPPR